MTENFNVDLAFRTLDAIKKNPEVWDQGSWRCGSGMCFAGWAAMLTGAKWVYPQDNLYVDEYGETDNFENEMVEIPEELRETFDGKEALHVSYFAEKVLGIDSDQRGVLFFGSNTIRMIEAMLLAIKDNPETTAHELWKIHDRYRQPDNCLSPWTGEPYEWNEPNE